MRSTMFDGLREAEYDVFVVLAIGATGAYLCPFFVSDREIDGNDVAYRIGKR
jgi:hypothetical protein